MSARSGFRPDIEGLRAVAIGAVLLCHAGVAFFAGGYIGVDVFFVVSGFLITRLLLGELDTTGDISLRRFYARRAKRLLPLTAVLLAAVGILSLLLLSPVRAAEVSGDIISSALYTANWHFAAQSVDYFAQEVEPSPVLHLWSLAIEEQFYLVWPTLLLAVTWFRRNRGSSLRPAIWATLAIVLAGSLALGIHLTDSQPAAAYFSTFGRAWELALGASLAVLGAVRIPRAIAAGIGWAGLAAIVYSAVVFDASTPFPGTAALLPTLGTAALILAGSSIHAQTKGAPAWLLSLSPVRYVGRISYSWYLWHWPALIFAAVILGPLSVPAALAVVAVSWIPTAVTHHLIEDPLRLSRALARRPNRSLAIGLACTAIGVCAGIGLTRLQPTLHTAPLSDVKGAAALHEQPNPQQRATAVRPNPLRAAADRSRAYYDGCLVGINGTNSNKCLYGDSNGKRTLILFGDSHAMQYFPALEELAETHRWRLIMLTKAECTPGEVKIRSMIADREYSQCDAWRQETLRRIEMGGGSALVVMSGDTAYVPYDDKGEELSGRAAAAAMEAGYVATLTRIHRAGLRTVVIQDTPASASNVPSCVSEDLQHLESCAFPRVHDKDKEFDVRAARRSPGAHLIDINREICPQNLCRAVIGNALVYRDKSHLSATFARTLAPGIERGLKRAGVS
ncbi:MAG TPA: acyltransferase family protein [Solirubrobacterales bacterium]|jgi:peptidoglycan/LPS O-acetylase OafA/YrhL|nr:acyltransferase family protein [Solirubrobacterales bacterium]